MKFSVGRVMARRCVRTHKSVYVFEASQYFWIKAIKVKKYYIIACIIHFYVIKYLYRD